jgi:23S rRNA pseudouridine955/2504/2580 synthase
VAQTIIGGKSRPSGRRSVDKRADKPAEVPTTKTAVKPVAKLTPKPELPATVQQCTVDEGSEGQRLDNYLVKVLKGAPKTLVYRIIRSGEVRVNKGRASADTRLALGDVVRIPPLRLSDKAKLPAQEAAAAEDVARVPAREFPVLFEDDWMLVIDKPAGVAVHGGSGVSFGVIEQLRRARPEARFLELVHRLDKETSGILLIAKKRSALTTLQDAFRNRLAHKTYSALAIGNWPVKQKVIDVPLHKYLTGDGERRVRAVTSPKDGVEGQRAITIVSVTQAYAGYSLLDVTIKTGRTHQIRVHLLHGGHPIVGDDKYGDFDLNHRLARQGGANGEGRGEGRFERMFLHARYLRLPHPDDGRELVFEAALPPECRGFLATLQPLPSAGG